MSVSRNITDVKPEGQGSRSSLNRVFAEHGYKIEGLGVCVVQMGKQSVLYELNFGGLWGATGHRCMNLKNEIHIYSGSSLSCRCHRK